MRAMRAFPRARFRQVYGSTESSAVATFLTPDLHDSVRGKLRSCGRPYPGIGLRVVDPKGETLPTGQVGEIVIQGPCAMKGYWRNPEATRAAFFDGGWLRTGDAGYFDQEGFLYIYDRVKDMIVTGAENVYPAEVENALFGHPAIADVAVIGVPYDNTPLFDAGSAYVFMRSGSTWTQQQKLLAPAGAEQDYFGYSVSVAANTVIAGAPSAFGPGSAHVFGEGIKRRSRRHHDRR